ncbi:sensor histidine kinase [Lachnospiraceae bacterium 54-11]
MKFKSGFFRRPETSSLKNKLLCIYFLLVVLPLGFFTVYACLRVRGVMQKQTLTAAQNAFDDTFLSLQQTFRKLDEVLDILVMDPIVYDMASNAPEDYTYISRLEDSDQLALTFAYLCNLSGLQRIRLYADNDYLYASGQNSIVQLREVSGSNWYTALSSQDGRTWFAPPDFADQPEGEREWFSSMQVIYNPRNVRTPLAVLRADIDARHVVSLAENTSVTENGILLLLRGDEILYHSSGSPAPKSFGALAGLLPASDTGVWEPVQIEGADYYVQCRALSMEGWRMVSLLPFNDIFRLSHELRLEMLIIVAILGAAAYLLAVALSKSTLNRIFLLAQTMRRVEQGDVDVRIALSGNDEISQLMGNFNQMMNRIDGLMEEKVLYGQQIKNLELKALQAQINPHFLYNSLDLINCTAISRNVPEISRMVKALGRFYRISLSGGNDRIPLADEIRHAQLYTDIQNMRFENRVQVDWCLDETAGECLIVKITLQPLIENAIIHGILEKPSRKGHLRVTTARSKKRVTITIEDDGVGMDEETLRMNFSPVPRNGTDGIPGNAHVKSRDTDDAAGGYGVRNICERLRIAYGPPYGLFCKSTPGKGAAVTILIPAVTPGDTPAFEGGTKPERTSL